MCSGSDIGTRLGVAVERIAPLSGGDLSSVHAVTLADGRCLVAKRGGPLENEARMLRALAAAGCPAPEVVLAEPDLLVMTRLPEGRPGTERGYAEAGRAVARLHARRGESYGWEADHAFGAAPCPAAPAGDWPTFWAERRLLAWPEALPAPLARRLERLAADLGGRVPRHPPASLLHGDLWSGNLLFDGEFSGLIDPACYHGHAEVDLAMLTLFGRPRESFWEAYGPLEPGWEARRPLYRLWPALVHLRLFGSGYRGMVEGCLDRLGA